MKLQILLFLSCVLQVARTSELENDVNAAKRSLINWDLTNVLALKEKTLQSALINLLINTYDVFCNVVVQKPLMPIPNDALLNLHFMTVTHNYSVPLTRATELLDIPAYDRRKPLVLFATGWQNSISQSGALYQLWSAFSCRGDVNFIVIDAAHYMETFYSWSARNAEYIAEQIGYALAALYAKRGFILASAHLIGHSLGAQIVGKAARQFYSITGRKLPRLTALDPARPCFPQNAIGLLSVQRGDAALVVVVHTNMGVLGKQGPLGDIDFYPGGAVTIQPGCFTISCSHSRAIDYFAESVYPGQEHHFVAQRCDDWEQLVAQNCKYAITNTMGYRVNARRRGIFYVPVRTQSPYGFGATNTDTPKCNYQDQEKSYYHIALAGIQSWFGNMVESRNL